MSTEGAREWVEHWLAALYPGIDYGRDRANDLLSAEDLADLIEAYASTAVARQGENK